MSLPEYESNPYISGLPGIAGFRTTFDMMSRPPSWDRTDLDLPPVLRRHCVLRLKRYFRPGTRNIVFAEAFSMMVRNGYVDRNPADGRHEINSLHFGELAKAGDLIPSRRLIANDGYADCSVLVGEPGMGKTLTIKEVLRSYTQVIEHPDLPPQITYIRLDTPPRGSLRGLCVSFFAKVDELLRQDRYTKLYAGQHDTEETMLQHMALVARFHGLGCLVVDEIQHLPQGGEEDHALLTFLVTLANTMGVPVLFVGTMKALRLFERTARMARRSVGNFGGPWQHYQPDDDDWALFLEDLWQYRWTRGAAELDQRMRHVFYDETQGVVDLAVKLMMRVQMRVLIRSDQNPDLPEDITPDFVRQVARADLAPVRSFLDALRSGDRDKINAYDDLGDFQSSFDRTSDELGTMPKIALSTPQRHFDDDELVTAAPAEIAVRAELQARGINSDLIGQLIDQAKLELNDDAPSLFSLTEKVQKLMKASRSTKKAAVLEPNLVEGDLRALAMEAGQLGKHFHEMLALAGIGGQPALRLP